MKRKMLVAGMVVAALAAASCVQYAGDPRPVGPHADVAIRDSRPWYSPPTLFSRSDEPDALYVLAPEMPRGTAFAAVRIDIRTLQQTRVAVEIGPHTLLRGWRPADVRIRVRGLRFDRPAFHLFAFPYEGRGPGFHRVDSATGRIDVLSGERLLLARNAYNSSDILMMLSLISSDEDGRWIAALTRAEAGWRLLLFRT